LASRPLQRRNEIFDQIVGVLDETLDRYRADYHRAGAKYGASDQGMVRWFEERTINFGM